MKSRNWFLHLLLYLFLFVIIPLSVFAESENRSSFGGLGAIIIILLIHHLEKKSKERNNGEIIGIDGWLLFFIIGLFGIAIIQLTTWIFTILFLGIGGLDIIPFILDIFFAIGSVYVGISLLKYKKNAVLYAKLIVVLELIWAAVWYYYTSNSKLYDAEWSGVGLAFTVAYSLIWLPYLFLSRRVKNTYNSKTKITIPTKSWATITGIVSFQVLIMVLLNYFIIEDSIAQSSEALSNA